MLILRLFYINTIQELIGILFPSGPISYVVVLWGGPLKEQEGGEGKKY